MVATTIQHSFLAEANIEIPVIGGPMYPCSNPELVAAISEAGGLGIIQPVTLTYVFGHEFRAGVRLIKSRTKKPIGMNALIETSSKRYLAKMQKWIDIALEEGVRFFVTSLGKPDWVVQQVHAVGGIVYHDATDMKWAAKAVDVGVDGLIAVNSRAGGHAGRKSADALYRELSVFNLPLICAGGIGNVADYQQALRLGYQGVQMGTRFIATPECAASQAYKHAILDAKETDVILSERITGVPVSILKTTDSHHGSVNVGPVSRFLLQRQSSKHLMRLLLTLRSAWLLKRASLAQAGSKEYWQAGKSVGHITSIRPVADILREFRQADLKNIQR